MKFFINSILTLLVIFFFIKVINFYTSERNTLLIFKNRDSFKKVIENNSVDIPVLLNDTDNIIEFNSGFQNENEKERKFWELFRKEKS
tara:strand:+ start:2239 stop:2502 length:264 start_codon:yes stop_codon:yes gene_type:complete